MGGGQRRWAEGRGDGRRAAQSAKEDRAFGSFLLSSCICSVGEKPEPSVHRVCPEGCSVGEAEPGRQSLVAGRRQLSRRGKTVEHLPRLQEAPLGYRRFPNYALLTQRVGKTE